MRARDLNGSVADGGSECHRGSVRRLQFRGSAAEGADAAGRGSVVRLAAEAGGVNADRSIWIAVSRFLSINFKLSLCHHLQFYLFHVVLLFQLLPRATAAVAIIAVAFAEFVLFLLFARLWFSRMDGFAHLFFEPTAGICRSSAAI